MDKNDLTQNYAMHCSRYLIIFSPFLLHGSQGWHGRPSCSEAVLIGTSFLNGPEFFCFFPDSADDSDESVRSQTTETAHPPQDLDLGSVQEV